MKPQKNKFYILLLSFIFFILYSFPISAQAQESQLNSPLNHPTFWSIQKASSMHIQGSTNVNEFNCELSSTSLSDTLSFTPDYINTTLVFENSHIHIDANQFNCHNPLITSDFRKTIKSEEFPYITITFIGIKISPELDLENTVGTIQIQLAGVSKDYIVNYKITQTDNYTWLLEGEQDLSFTDFNLEPPTRFMNLVKVNDEIRINFSLALKQIF